MTPAGPVASGCVAKTAPYSIVGAPSNNGTYTGAGRTSIGSANEIGSGCDETMFYESATFLLTINGLTATNFDSLSTVAFGFGPDAPGSPDRDDWSIGTPISTTTSTTPEPASMALMGTGLVAIALARRAKKLTCACLNDSGWLVFRT